MNYDVLPMAWIISALLALVGTLFGLIIAMLGWLGSRLYARLGELAASIHKIEGDLHGKISGLDRRVTRVETKVFGE